MKVGSGLQVEEREGIAWLRIQRPEVRNAFDPPLLAEMTAAVRASRAGVLVITGSDGAFCAGGHLGELAEPDPERLRELFEGALRLFTEIRSHPSPVIAAVNGPAVGGGNELVVACDLAIAAESAIFGQTGPKVGSAPVLGGTNLLALSIGEKRAKEVSFLCRRYTARQALEMGWINAVVPDEVLEEEVTRWGRELLSTSRRYLEIAKLSSNAWWNLCQESFRSGVGMLVQAIGSEDMLEGARAFREKRPARFPSRGEGTSRSSPGR
jgi:2-ketocyclohexanecarboxyl-CoA hydrolase